MLDILRALMGDKPRCVGGDARKGKKQLETRPFSRDLDGHCLFSKTLGEWVKNIFTVGIFTKGRS